MFPTPLRLLCWTYVQLTGVEGACTFMTATIAAPSVLRAVDQTLWRRILGATIAALEEEQDDDGSTTAQALANYRTPTSQIAALEDRLCALAGAGSVADYFGGGRVRVPRKAILGRYGMAG